MNDEGKSSKKWVTRSIVQPKTVLKMNSVPDIEREMKQYSHGKLETRSIVRPPIHLNMHRVQPYLKMTLGFRDDVELTYDAAMQIGSKLIQAVIEAAPELRLQYSTGHSKVEDGRLIAALIPQNQCENVEELLHDFVGHLRDRVPLEREEPTTVQTQQHAQPTYMIDYVPMGSY